MKMRVGNPKKLMKRKGKSLSTPCLSPTIFLCCCLRALLPLETFDVLLLCVFWASTDLMTRLRNRKDSLLSMYACIDIFI